MGMTLEEYKNIMEASESDKEYICNWCKKNFYTEEQQDEFAIEFLIWASQFSLQRFDTDKWQVLGLAAFGFTKTVSTKEILEEFKKEKGL